MESRKTESFKLLTISLENLPASMARQDELTSYAAQRAKLLLGCYRTGDANDPDTYVAAITAILARYPEHIITEVTHPATGLPKKKSWLPTVKEVVDTCDDAIEFEVQHQARLKRIEDQMAARRRQDAGIKPTMDELKERFGENWGLNPPAGVKSREEKAAENASALEKSRERVKAEYEQVGLQMPSKFALSFAARRLVAQQDELRQAAE